MSLKNVKAALNWPVTMQFLFSKPGNIVNFFWKLSKVSRWAHSWFSWRCLKGCCVFFSIWHAARTYGRRRGNTIVSHFWIYQLYLERTWSCSVSNHCWEGRGEVKHSFEFLHWTDLKEIIALDKLPRMVGLGSELKYYMRSIIYL